MANITKNQIKSRLKKILEVLGEQRDLLEELKDEVESESYDIEPYEGKDDLTESQCERQEWLDDCSSQIDDQLSTLDDVISCLEDITNS